MYSRITLVLGGAASGKSRFAEQLVANAGKSPVYIATAQAFDDEMRRKIDLHVDRRGSGWTTIEAPQNVAPSLAGLTPNQICLLDCATMWLSNQMMAGTDIASARTELMQSLKTCAADVIVVSNEVGHGIVPDNALARRFREEQGQLNIALAALADLVVQVTAGLPMVLKGQMA